MARSSTQSSTVVLGRMFAAPVATVFAALVEPDLRERVGLAGSDRVILHEASDCRVGGRDLLRFGPRTNPRFAVECLYHDILAPVRIVASEIFSAAGERHAIGLTMWELEPRGERTQLRLTAHLVLLQGLTSSDIARMRHETLLDALERFLEGAADRGAGDQA